jgi:hypothetical protein
VSTEAVLAQAAPTEAVSTEAVLAEAVLAQAALAEAVLAQAALAQAAPTEAVSTEAAPTEAAPAEAAPADRKAGAPRAHDQAPARVARVLRRLVGVRPSAEVSGGAAAQQAETSAPEPPPRPVQGDTLAPVAGPTHAAASTAENFEAQDVGGDNFEAEDVASENFESEDFVGEQAVSRVAGVTTPRKSGAVARTLLRRLVRRHGDPRQDRAGAPRGRSAGEPAAVLPPSAETERLRATEPTEPTEPPSPGIDALAEPVAAPRPVLPLDLTTREHARAGTVEHPTVSSRARSTERRVLRRPAPRPTDSQRSAPLSARGARPVGESSNAAEPSAAGRAAPAPEASVASATAASAGEPLVVLRELSTTDIEAEDTSGDADQSGDAAEEPDLDQLAEQVYTRLRSRLVVDRERAGRASRWA